MSCDVAIGNLNEMLGMSVRSTVVNESKEAVAANCAECFTDAESGVLSVPSLRWEFSLTPLSLTATIAAQQIQLYKPVHSFIQIITTNHISQPRFMTITFNHPRNPS